MWGVWANFINKINEQIEFELRNSDNKLKIQLSEENEIVSSNNLKIHYFKVFFIDIWLQKNGQIKLFWEMFEKFFLKITVKSFHEGGLDKFQL